MESMNKLLIMLFIFSGVALAKKSKKKTRKLFYYKKTYGHIHELSNKHSPSLTTISCGHPLVFIKYKEDKVGEMWIQVRASNVKGYVDTKHISKTRPQCQQRIYPKFWNSLDMDVSELYYWGRLYDQYIEGDSRIR